MLGCEITTLRANSTSFEVRNSGVVYLGEYVLPVKMSLSDKIKKQIKMHV